jgi:hypothetical protein
MDCAPQKSRPNYFGHLIQMFDGLRKFLFVGRDIESNCGPTIPRLRMPLEG